MEGWKWLKRWKWVGKFKRFMSSGSFFFRYFSRSMIKFKVLNPKLIEKKQVVICQSQECCLQAREIWDLNFKFTDKQSFKPDHLSFKSSQSLFFSQQQSQVKFIQASITCILLSPINAPSQLSFIATLINQSGRQRMKWNANLCSKIHADKNHVTNYLKRGTC